MSPGSDAVSPWPRASAHASLSRSRLFFGLFLLAGLNSVAGHAVRSVDEGGWLFAAVNLFGVSAIVWVALLAGLTILVDGGDERPRRADLPFAALIIIATLLPSAMASKVALTLLALYAIFASERGSTVQRAGIIFLAMTGALAWGRLALDVFSRPLLDIDAAFVGSLLGVEHRGNLLWSRSGEVRLIVFPACSSVQGMSLALLFWATVNQYFRVRFGWKAAGWCLLALAATIAINIVRMAAMLEFPAQFEAIHLGWGAQLAMWTTLAAVVAICVYGARDAIFDR